MKRADPPIIVKNTYSASIEKVWSAITNVEQMTQWFFNNIPDFRPEIGFATQFVGKRSVKPISKKLQKS